MDKEKYKNLIETLPKESEELWFEYNLEVNKILQENKKYKEVIDKAIEVIYAHSSMEPPYYEFREFYNASNLSELLDILKEVE